MKTVSESTIETLNDEAQSIYYDLMADGPGEDAPDDPEIARRAMVQAAAVANLTFAGSQGENTCFRDNAGRLVNLSNTGFSTDLGWYRP